MKRASIYLAVAWILFFANELSGSLLSFAAFALYFLALFAGAIAAVIELLMALFKKYRWKSALSMTAAVTLAVVPFFFMMEIREGVARAEDFFLRDSRLEALETIRAEKSPKIHDSILLPDEYAHLSEEGCILLLELNENNCAAAFWNRTGFLGGGQATVYCSDGTPPTEDLLNTPKIYLCKPLGDGWFFTSFE